MCSGFLVPFIPSLVWNFWPFAETDELPRPRLCEADRERGDLDLGLTDLSETLSRRPALGLTDLLELSLALL